MATVKGRAAESGAGVLVICAAMERARGAGAEARLSAGDGRGRPGLHRLIRLRAIAGHGHVLYGEGETRAWAVPGARPRSGGQITGHGGALSGGSDRLESFVRLGS